MSSEYYTHGSYPATGAAGSSSGMRSELDAVDAGFAKLPTITGNGGKVLAVNAGATALEAITTTGTGSGVRATSPTLVTPVLGVATLTSANKVAITAPATAATLALAEGSTLATSGAFSQTLTATAATNVTLPTTGTLATLAGAETLTNKTLTSPAISSPTGITATNISNTPARGITESNVQGALDGLEIRKASLGGDDFTGNVAAPTVNGTPLLHHNDIINGDFRIAQAGTSFAAPANGAYDLDGWANLNTSAAVFTVAQVAGSTTGRLARQVTITTADATVAAGDYVCDSAAIEGYNIEKYVGSTFTVAFRAKVPVAGIHCVALRNSGNDRSYVKEINFPTANVWQDCTFTVTGGLPTAGTWNYTNGTGLKVTFARMVGTTFQTTPDAWQTGNFLATANQVNDCATNSNAWAFEKVTLNRGTVAAVSEIDVGDELRRCQRHFQRLGGGAPNAGLAAGLQRSTTDSLFIVCMLEVMASVPVVGFSALNVTDRTTFDAAVTSITVEASPNSATVAAIHTAAGAGGKPVFLSPVAGGFLSLSARLSHA